MMAEAGLKIFAAALAFTVAVMVADIADPGSAGWLWARVITENYHCCSAWVDFKENQ